MSAELIVTVELHYADPMPPPFPSPVELAACLRAKVIEFERPFHEGIFEQLFAEFNRGSGREDPALDAFGLRSLSVGDAVVLRSPDGNVVAAVCASAGWQKLPWGNAAPAT